MARTITITENPKIEAALRELEKDIEDISGGFPSSGSVTSTVIIGGGAYLLGNPVNTPANHVMGSETGVNVDTSGGNRTVYLASSPATGRRYHVSNRGVNQVTVNGSGRDINGDSTLILQYQNSTAQLEYNGTEWVIR